VSAGSALPRMKPCKNDIDCPACFGLIQDEGPHVRYCSQCREYRARLSRQCDMAMLEPVVTRQRLGRYGVGRDGWFEDEVDFG